MENVWNAFVLFEIYSVGKGYGKGEVLEGWWEGGREAYLQSRLGGEKMKYVHFKSNMALTFF